MKIKTLQEQAIQIQKKFTDACRPYILHALDSSKGFKMKYLKGKELENLIKNGSLKLDIRMFFVDENVAINHINDEASDELYIPFNLGKNHDMRQLEIAFETVGEEFFEDAKVTCSIDLNARGEVYDVTVNVISKENA